MKKLVIIANGSSLNKHYERGDFELLKNVDTLAMNEFDRFIEKHDLDFLPTIYTWWEQDSHLSARARAIKVVEHFIDKGVRCYLARHFYDWMVASKLMPKREHWYTIEGNVQFVSRCWQRNHGGQLDDCSPGGWHLPRLCIYGGSMIGVTQLAYMLGYNEVGIAGADLGFMKKVTHFDKNYPSSFEAGMKLDRQDDTLRNVHQWAKDEFEKVGRKIYNVGIGGELEVYPRIELREFV